MTVKEALLAKTIVKRPSWYINRHIIFFEKYRTNTFKEKFVFVMPLFATDEGKNTSRNRDFALSGYCLPE